MPKVQNSQKIVTPEIVDNIYVMKLDYGKMKVIEFYFLANSLIGG